MFQKPRCIAAAGSHRQNSTGCVLRDDDGQCRDAAGVDVPARDGAQVELAANRPIEAEHGKRAQVDRREQVFGQDVRIPLAVVALERLAAREQLDALRLAERLHDGPVGPAAARSRQQLVGELVHEARR